MTGAELAGSCSLLWAPALRSEPLLARGTQEPTVSKYTLIHFSRAIHPLRGVSRAALPSQGSPPLEFQGREAVGLQIWL